MLDNSPEQIWDSRYVHWIEKADEDGEIPGAAVYGRYLDALLIEPQHAVLDLGVGTGRLVPELLARADRLAGLDLSMTMMSRARDRFGDRVPLVNGNAQWLPFADASFDRVVAWAIWENIPDQKQALREIARILRPGGRVLFGTKNWAHHRSWRIVWYRGKQNRIRRFWRWVCARPALRRFAPGALCRKCERVMDRREVPQYPTLWSGLLRAARRSGLSVELLHKFNGASYTDEVRAPEAARYFQKLVTILARPTA